MLRLIKSWLALLFKLLATMTRLSGFVGLTAISASDWLPPALVALTFEPTPSVPEGGGGGGGSGSGCVTPNDSYATVTAVVAGTRGTVTTPGQNASGQTVLGRGDSRVYTLAPAPGYKPVLVPGPNACTGMLSNNTFTVNNVQNDCFVRIRFVPKDALTSVPTLSEWGLIILSVAMGLFALGVRRQQMR